MSTAWSEYDPAWPDQARKAIEELHGVLPGVFERIEHIGSTSVPGLAAKAVIDLMAPVGDLEQVAARRDVLEELGYQLTETGMTGRLFFARDTDGRRTHHLHVVTADNWDTQNERLLRDHLLRYPEDAERYAALKRRLVEEHGVGGDEYTRAKTDLIQELVDRARDERGLPRVPVWED